MPQCHFSHSWDAAYFMFILTILYEGSCCALWWLFIAVLSIFNNYSLKQNAVREPSNIYAWIAEL